MSKFVQGNTVFFVANSIYIRKATVIRSAGGFCTIQFDGTKGGIRVRESKLFLKEEDAMRQVNENNGKK